MSSVKILPGTPFPSIVLPVINGKDGEKTTNLVSTNKSFKLVVVYRGQFCPFCQGTLAHIQSKVEDLANSNIELVAVSADLPDAASAYVTAQGLTFPIAHSLQEKQIHELGLYVSSPTHYIPQTHKFSEPAYFFLTPENIIKYMTISSHPMGGRVNVDHLFVGLQRSKERIKTIPEFASVVWGSD